MPSDFPDLDAYIAHQTALPTVIDVLLSRDPEQTERWHLLRHALQSGMPEPDVVSELLRDPPELLEWRHPLPELANQLRLPIPAARRFLKLSGLMDQRLVCAVFPPRTQTVQSNPRVRLSAYGLELVAKVVESLMAKPFWDRRVYDVLMSPVPLPGEQRDPIFNVIRKDLLLDFATTWRRLV